MEQTFRAGEGVLLIEGRVLRRVLKAHRNLKGLGLSVPHVHCYALPRDELLRVASEEDLDPNVRAHLQHATSLRSVILVARLSAAETARLPPEEVTNRLWRAAFHARIHVEIEERMDSGVLSEAAVRERIDRLGQTEFDEVREALRQDDLLLPPGGDREAYAEFVALFLELRYFAPRLLATTFPSLDVAKVEPEIARDVDARLLLERACPEGVDPGRTIAIANAATTSTATSVGQLVEPAKFVAPEGSAADRYLARAASARDKKNVVRAALYHAAVALGRDRERVKIAQARKREDVEALSDRLKTALRPPPSAPEKPDLEWASMLMILSDEAALRSSSSLRFPIEARLLFDLQKVALANERQSHAVDLITAGLSLGKRPIVRPLPATRTLRIARTLAAAAKKVKLCRLQPADRKLLTKLVDRAVERAEENVRAELRPRIVSVLDEVGLRPASTPERVARDKLVEELLDQAALHGFITLGHVRDALSRNHLKLEDLSSAGELWAGDPILRADKAFAVSLDGVYRPGEVYLRGLQKVSSLLFGTPVGRAIVLYVFLPLGGAFILLEGVGHLIHPIAGLFGVHDFTLFLGGPKSTRLPTELTGLASISFWITAVFVFGLLHSDPFRAVMMRVARILGKALEYAFVKGPKALLSIPTVERMLEGRAAKVVARHALVPGVIASIVYLLAWKAFGIHSTEVLLVITLSVFAIVSATLVTRVGDALEDAVVEHVAPTWKMLSNKVLPGMLRGIVDFFRWGMEGMERVIYRVDEALRFREGENRLSIGAKAGLGALWFLVAYTVRIYVALLIEPYVNPVKQVPMTAAAHKIMLPFAPQVATLLNSLIGGVPIIGGTLVAVTVFFFPTIFGFFGWELKENYKLYRASRKKTLPESQIGAHGETMNGLLVAGFHSGTLPKIFARLRHSARREEEIERMGGPAEADKRRLKDEGARGRFREGVHEVETSVKHFIEREMLSLLAADPRWTHGPLQVEKVKASSNRVRVSLVCPGVPRPEKPGVAPTVIEMTGPPSLRTSPSACEVSFEEQSGYVVAGITQVGFADWLLGPPRILFENALAGLYKLAATDLVREQLEMALGGDVPYDITDDGLIVWPGPGYVVEALYPLRIEGSTIEPNVRGGIPPKPLPPLDARAISFRHQPIAWSAWVYAWSSDAGREVPRLMSGPSLIP